MTKSNELKSVWRLLLLLALSNSGCATKSVPVPVCPVPQRVPESLKEPAPPSDFSQKAQLLISKWLQQLMLSPTGSEATKR